ncbi:CCA tRNA nucleotidyltransferase [Corynebacterium bovis]|nr:CCA tRNA nucleotidyltransferase [Corynebacterium bovis]
MTTTDRPVATTKDRSVMLATAWRTIRGLDRDLLPVAEAFRAQGHTLHLVGGSVRDALLGRLSHDLDFTTDARPEQVVEILTPLAETVWDTGIAYGTVSAMIRGTVVEITTYRADTYDGDSRNPQVTYGDTLEGDLVRRDFRCNAMALELSPVGEHVFHDPLGGLDDLEAGILDTPAAPETSFHDDPLRMLRACRFVAQLGFDVSARVREAMTAMSGEIARITVERVQAELNTLLLGVAPGQGLDLMVDTGLGDVVLPELPALRLTQDEHHQHKDVYLHSLQVLSNAVELEAERWADGIPLGDGEVREKTDDDSLQLRWAALLHDCGKPETREFTEEGGVTFHHHEVVGARMVRRRLKALKFPKRMTENIGTLVFLHMRFHGYSEGLWSDAAVRRYVADAGDLLPHLHLLVRADCTTRNVNKAAWLRRSYDQLEERIAELREREDLAAVRPDLDGDEIMEVLGLRPGPGVGVARTFLLNLRLDRGPLGREAAVAELRRWWDDGGSAEVAAAEQSGRKRRRGEGDRG